MAVHMCCESWCISLPFFAKQQREMTTFCVVRRTGITVNLEFEFCAMFHIQFPDKCDKEEETQPLHSIARFLGKI